MGIMEIKVSNDKNSALSYMKAIRLELGLKSKQAIIHKENREEDADRRERVREKVGGGNAGLLPVGLLWDSINGKISLQFCILSFYKLKQHTFFLDSHMHMNKPPYTLFWLNFTTLFLFTCCISFHIGWCKSQGCHQITAFEFNANGRNDNIILFLIRILYLED